MRLHQCVVADSRVGSLVLVVDSRFRNHPQVQNANHTHTHTHRQQRDELREKLNQLRWNQTKLLIFQEELELRKAEATHHLVRPLLTLGQNCNSLVFVEYAGLSQNGRKTISEGEE